MMNQVKLIALLLLIFPISVASQSSYKNEVEARIGATVEKEFFNALEIGFSPSIRLGKDFAYDKTLLDLDVAYDVMQWFKLGVGGRMVFNETKKRGTEITSRVDVEISKSFKIKKFSVKPRIRYCHYFNVKNNDDLPNSNLLRYKVDFGYKHSKKTLFQPKIGVELYHSLQNNIVAAIRYRAGGSFRLAKGHSLSVDYMLDNDFNADENKHIIEVGYKFKF